MNCNRKNEKKGRNATGGSGNEDCDKHGTAKRDQSSYKNSCGSLQCCPQCKVHILSQDNNSSKVSQKESVPDKGRYAGKLTITEVPAEETGRNSNMSEAIEKVAAPKTDVSESHRSEHDGRTSNGRPLSSKVANTCLSSGQNPAMKEPSTVDVGVWSTPTGAVPGGAVQTTSNSSVDKNASNAEGPPKPRGTAIGEERSSNGANMDSRNTPTDPPRANTTVITTPEDERISQENRDSNEDKESWTYTPHEEKCERDPMGEQTSKDEGASNEPDMRKIEGSLAENREQPTGSFGKAYKPPFSEQSDRKPGLKSTNILLLGETGVGKTTFINSLVNHLKQKTLEGMLAEKRPRILISTAFTLSDENYKKLRVEFPANYELRHGVTDPNNEKLNDKGESTTQGAMVYNINYENAMGETKVLSIIDTPGMSDTRGEKQDKENFEKILRCIKGLGELHAICIVMKPNQARFSLSFRYNIEGFLTRLHRDAVKNILFCFTNTRSTLYRPGDTLATLQAYLDDLEKARGILLRADKHNIFCFDNDCFRYVLAVKNDTYQRTTELDAMFSESWARNVDESRKLLARAERLPIHNVQDTLSINRTQQLVTILAKPLAEIARNHLLNMRLTEEYMKQIKDLSNRQSNLRSQIKKTMVVLEPIKLYKPRTVCRKCTIWYKPPGCNDYMPEYQVCHDECHLDTSPHNGYCAAFRQTNSYGYHYGSYCVKCRCHKNYHEHQFYESVPRKIEVTDIRAQDEYQRTENRKKILEEEKEKYKSLEIEHDTIRYFCAEATVFLLENSIKSIGDPYLQQIENLIQDEESKKKLGGDPGMFYELSTLLEQYKNRVKGLQEDIRDHRRVPLTCDELMKKMDNLAILPHCGEQVKQLKAICEEKIHDIEEKAKKPELQGTSSSVKI